jgi:hypothetical protein
MIYTYGKGAGIPFSSALEIKRPRASMTKMKAMGDRASPVSLPPTTPYALVLELH